MAKDPEQPDSVPVKPPSRWTATIDTTYTDLVALMLCFVTGLCDSSAYNAWTCFLAMQTGNTVFLGLGASSQPTNKPWGWLKSLISITAFFTGTTFFTRLTRHLRPLRRGTLFLSFLLQTILIIISVALIQADLIPHDTVETEALTSGRLFLELVPIALLAFQSAGSIATTRALGFNEVPSVVLTSVYFDLGGDPGLFAGLGLGRDGSANGNVKRNRRAGAVVCLLVGAIVGGWLSRSAGGMESALWVSAGVKAMIGLGWLVWREEKIQT